MAPPATCWAPEHSCSAWVSTQCQSTLNSVSTWSWLSFQLEVPNDSLHVTVKWLGLFKINGFLAVYGANLGSGLTLSETEKNLFDLSILSQYMIFFFTMLQFKFALQAEINESPVKPELGQAKFPSHCSHEATNILQLATWHWWNGEGSPEMLWPLLSLSTSRGLLRWLSRKVD